MHRQRLQCSAFLLVALSCNACAPLQGPQADLTTIATPDPLPQAVRTVPQPPPGPTPEQGHFRAWVPPQASANGDQVQGHWLVISNTPPALESLEPAQPMPRAPRAHVGAKPAAQQPSPSQGPMPLSQVPTPPPVLPTSLSTLDGQGTPRLQRPPLSRSLVGGQ